MNILEQKAENLWQTLNAVRILLETNSVTDASKKEIKKVLIENNPHSITVIMPST